MSEPKQTQKPGIAVWLLMAAAAAIVGLIPWFLLAIYYSLESGGRLDGLGIVFVIGMWIFLLGLIPSLLGTALACIAVRMGWTPSLWALLLIGAALASLMAFIFVGAPKPVVLIGAACGVFGAFAAHRVGRANNIW